MSAMSRRKWQDTGRLPLWGNWHGEAVTERVAPAEAGAKDGKPSLRNGDGGEGKVY